MSTLMPRRRGWLGALALLAVSLAGCGGLLPQAPERQIYRLNAAVSFPAPLPRAPIQLIVATPGASADLDTQRVALTTSPVALDYFANAQWNDRLPFVVRTALIDGFEKSGAVAAVAPESLGIGADAVLDTQIRDFEAVYDSPNGPPRAVVKLDIKLLRMPGRRIVADTTISGEAPASANSLPQIVEAFNAALGAAVRDTVAWTVTNRGLSERPRR